MKPVRRVFGACLVLAACVAVAQASASETLTLNAQLAAPVTSSHARPASSASGALLASVAPAKDGYELGWQLSFSGLSGRATAAYLRRGGPRQVGPAWLLLCSPCKNGSAGRAYFSPPELILAQQGELYVSIQTTAHPAGELRGQLVVGGASG